MKKIFTIMCVLFASLSMAQSSKGKVLPNHVSSKVEDYVAPKDTTNFTTDMTSYVSVGLSMSNMDNFRNGSYFSLEYGVTKQNLSLSMVVGRGNITGMFKDVDHIQNYYYEPKVTVGFPLGKLTGTAIFGVGGYFGTSHMLIEYGSGISYQIGDISYGILYSNWDGVDYITPNITYNF